MSIDLNEKIVDFISLRNGYIVRDGYVFISWNDQPNIYDVLVIRSPMDAVGNTRLYPESMRTIEEHIQLINEAHIKRALVIADDLSFIERCPSLKELSVSPPNTFGNAYDYSPLYNIPDIHSLNCRTTYGDKDQFSSIIDYSKIHGVLDLAVYGKGHLNYDKVESLEKLWISNMIGCKDFYAISCSMRLKDITVLQCGIKSLDGIERYTNLQSLNLSYDRSLNDISKIRDVAQSLRALVIDSCSRISDFSCLYELINLEHLILRGNNTIPDLIFLKNMKKLKTFTFSMEVESGDLSPCLQIPYVSCSKNKKWYNLKDNELPKNGLTEAFRVI